MTLRRSLHHEWRQVSGEDTHWTLVDKQQNIRQKKEEQGTRDAKSNKDRRVGAKRDKDDVLVIKPDKFELMDLVADVRSIWRIRTVKMILKIKWNKTWMGGARSLWWGCWSEASHFSRLWKWMSSSRNFLQSFHKITQEINFGTLSETFPGFHPILSHRHHWKIHQVFLSQSLRWISIGSSLRHPPWIALQFPQEILSEFSSKNFLKFWGNHPRIF